MTDGVTEMDLYDAMHPLCRQALANAPFHFNLCSMPATALNWAVGKPKQAPGRFIGWLEREVEAVRARER